MPNWVCNKIAFEDEEAAAIVRKAVETSDAGFDFNKIIPMSESLLVCAGRCSNIALNYFKGEITDEEARAELPLCGREPSTGKADITTLSQLRELGRQVADNVERYGCANWYDWSVRNWGTKWNASDINWEGSAVYFSTAWCAPIPIFEAIALNFPGVGFVATWSEEQFDLVTGAFVASSDGGHLLRQPYAETYEAFVLACSIWDPDQEEHRWDSENSCIVRCFEDYDEQKEHFDSLPVIDIDAAVKEIVSKMKKVIDFLFAA